MRVLLLAFVVTVGSAAAVKDWWETALIYQIYPRSFMDSNGDGIGDLNGITSKLSYLRDTGVDGVWLSPIYLSPMYDFGYDITNYTAIAVEYGTMEDFDRLMAEAKSLGIRIILDFVPNHTSNESEWFIKSAARQDGYDNYYVWADGITNPEDPNGTPLPPNNWISIFRKSAWEWNPTRKQYYLHQFVIGQPDLNYREPKVQEDMKNVLRFWLDKGVSGFRVDAVNMMYEVDPADYGGKFPDEPLSGATGLTPDDYDYLTHIYTRDLRETYNVIFDWRDVLTEYLTQEYKIMMTEAYADLKLMIDYYGNGSRNGSIPFNFSFLSDITSVSNARDIKATIDRWMTYMPIGKTANWVNGNHDQSRLATRQGVDRVDAMNMLALLLPGVTITYQGEELGMTDGYLTWEQTVDPQACNADEAVYMEKSRDPARTPFHWDATANAGFSNSTNGTWLPVADNYRTVNVDVEKKANKSHYQFYKDLVKVKKLEAVKEGDLQTLALNEDVLVVARLLPGEQGIVGILNLSSEEHVVDLTSLRTLPPALEVVTVGVNSPLAKQTRVTKTAVTITGKTAIVLQSVARVPKLPW